MKRTQVQWVKERLLTEGEISRNICLQNYITRLAAIIHILKRDGWEFKEIHRGGDYVYQVIKKPELKLF